MAQALLSLIGAEAGGIAATSQPRLGGDSPDSTVGAEHVEERIKADTEMLETEKQALIKARSGQGKFRNNVARYEKQCRVTGIDNPDYLIASHIKPWSQSSNVERLDGANGLLLSPHIDHLFDTGNISFSDSGDVICSSQVDRTVLKQLHIDPTINVGSFCKEQLPYLAYHREFRLKR